MIINSYVNSVLKVHKLTNLTPSVFLQPFLLPEYKSQTLFIPLALMKSWHCQNFSLSLNLRSRLTSPCTDSINCTRRNMWGLILSQHFLLKCLVVTCLSFLSFLSYLSYLVAFVDSKSSIKISSWTYILVSTVLTKTNVNKIRAITRQATSNTVHSTSHLKLKLLSDMR